MEFYIVLLDLLLFVVVFPQWCHFVTENSPDDSFPFVSKRFRNTQKDHETGAEGKVMEKLLTL